MTASPQGRLERYTAPPPIDTDRVLIIGAGLAGLFLALRLAPRRCVIVSPAPLGQASSSAWAQGGLAAALGPSDSPSAHAEDTIAAGAGLVDPYIAQMIASEGPARVEDLILLGVPFDRTPNGALALSLEAAHSHPRVARVSGDLAGKAIMDALITATRAATHIELIENCQAVSLLQDASGRVAGAVLKDKQARVSSLAASQTVLCTGGIGGLFRVTTNPPQAKGDALAMAYQVGAVLTDLEFIQFHPTAMDIGLDPAPLATEALRGEGARLISEDGTAFMQTYHPEGELAPRDLVARAIHQEIIAGRPVYLDTREAVGAEIEHHFPTVFKACQSAGIDPRQHAIPVAPAMHYHMGGILSDIWGRTNLNGLSVCGECANTGAHGANRLASNSLLEAVVMAARIADRLREDTFASPQKSEGWIAPSLGAPQMTTVRDLMALHCGVVRDANGLNHLLAKLCGLIDEYGPARALVCAEQIARAALAREESRGGHYRSDFPDPSPLAVHSYSSRVMTPSHTELEMTQ